MDALIRGLLDATQLDEWLAQHGIGWLLSQRALEVWSALLGAAVAYYLGRFVLSAAIRGVIKSTAKHRDWHKKDIEKRQETLVQLVRSFWKIVILGYVLAMIANKIFLIDLSPLFASAGIIGVALGFGAQSLVKDFLSGIFIIAENQYRVGDIVDIMGAAGKVERVGTRSTVIRDSDGNVHYIPNGTIQHVINKTMGFSVSRFMLQLDPATDIAAATEIINQTGQALASEDKWRRKIIEAPRFVSVGDITGRAVEIIVSGKTMPSDQWAVTSEMRRRLLEAFEAHQIELATLPTSHGAKK
ncbi:MAG: mechanosensitive ion channel family protein [Candidatus Saccharibacteria bacterium]|nr:mechanosensitive ion channel family protein [Candidatus Saccharibacteria bacterium]